MRQLWLNSLFWLGFFIVAALLMVRPVHAVTMHWVPSSGVSVGADGSTNLPAGSGSSLTNIPAYSLLSATPSGTVSSFRPTGTQFIEGKLTTVAWLYGTTYAADTDISAISAVASARFYTAGDQIQLKVYAYNPTGANLNRILVATSPILSYSTLGSTQSFSFSNFTIATTGTIPANYRMVVEVLAMLQDNAAGTPRFYYDTATAGSTTNITYTEAASTVTPVVPNPTTTDQTVLLQEINNNASFLKSTLVFLAAVGSFFFGFNFAYRMNMGSTKFGVSS